MLPELSDIKSRRKQLGLSQSQLAEKTGVSQSAIAKIESGRLSPSYDSAKKIFAFFENVSMHSVLSAQEMMSSRVVTCTPEMLAKDAIKLMKKHGISQVPVIENQSAVGIVSERTIVDLMQKEKDTDKILEKKVIEIMEESLPQVTVETPSRAISVLLEHHQAALVVKKGKIAGIITRSDLLGSILKGKKQGKT